MIHSDTKRINSDFENHAVLDSGSKMELLAPAGSLAVFETAVAAGADAIYVGAPGLHARAVGKEFTLAEIAAMIDYGHGHGVKVYLAANSLLKEEEISPALATLDVLAKLGPDALILQDLGLFRLAKRYFPELHIHASTLLNAHNSLAARQLAGMGFSRVVLARELTVREIKRIHATNSVELEVFVHGALCFSYSGLCLFSSSLGGKSGLRGRCVQPCRRRYSYTGGAGGRKKGPAARKGGYFFSMNDLNAVRLLPDLQGAGVTSLKIEGRLRSAQYVDCVVRAYRLVLDNLAAGDKPLAEAMTAAEELLKQAMGRRTTSGFLAGDRPKAVVSPYHSGNIGIFLGRIDRVAAKSTAALTLRTSLAAGDRLRLHREKSGERVSFTVNRIMVKNKTVQQAANGARINLALPESFAAGDALYKVDTRAGRMLARGCSVIDSGPFIKKINRLQDPQRVRKILLDIGNGEGAGSRPAIRLPANKSSRGGKRSRTVPGSLPLWVKTDTLRLLRHRMNFSVERYVLTLDRDVFTRFLRMKNIRLDPIKIIWSLPPVILEAELDFFVKTIGRLIRQGFRTFQIGHLSQLQFFQKKSRLTLVGDYTLNILNSQALTQLHELGLQQAQAAIESDKHNLAKLSSAGRSMNHAIRLGLTVYGTPPLFTSRLVADHFRYGPPLVSPKGEKYALKKFQGQTIALAESPFSLLPVLPELVSMGLDYGVIDLCHQKLKSSDLDLLARRLAGKGRGRRLSTFNYQGKLL
jgi:putative protease